MAVKPQIRTERAADHPAVFQLNQVAFGGDAEAQLVDTLRTQATPIVSWVAVVDDAVVGHILFSPVTVDAHNTPLLMGLAPMAVQPDLQKQGIGTALVEKGLEECRQLGVAGVVVLGHPDYYPRFGFTQAGTFGLRCEFEAPPEAFMALELTAHAFASRRGVVHYHPAFRQVGE